MSKYSTRWLRNPRTYQELRTGAVRAKRANLPTSRDDKARHPQRSWKAHRPVPYRIVRG